MKKANHPPIKRHEALQPLSREHHDGLMLCWKIRTGFKRNIEPERIKHYTDWFWENYLAPHFANEEKHLFPILASGNGRIKKAFAQHRRLKRLFEEETQITKSLSLIEEELENHIRFEERVLFNEIQEATTPEQLLEIEKQHNATIACEDWKDEFWK